MGIHRVAYSMVGIVLLWPCVIDVAAQAPFHPINGTYYVGNSAGMYAHISDAETAIGPSVSGTVILTPGYTDVITSTLNIGPISGPGLKVIMMPGSTIQENIKDGSPGIRIREGSALECLGASSSGSVNGQLSPCQVTTGGGSVNMASMVTSGAQEMGHGQDVFGLQGVTFIPGGATVTAVGDFEGLCTPSLVANNNFFGGPNVTYIWHLGWGTSGGKMFVNNELRGGSGVSGALVYITGGETGWFQPTGPVIEGGEISCRGSGARSIEIDGDPTGSGIVGVTGVIFDHIWNQDCTGFTPSAPYISIHNADRITFEDMEFSVNPTVSPIISITESAPGLTNFIYFENDTVICQNVNCAGQTNWISDTTAGGYTHKLPPVTVNLEHYGYFTYIQSDEAGNWPGGSVLQGIANGGTVVNQTDVNLNATNENVTNATDLDLSVTNSGVVGSASYQDASVGYAWRVQNQGDLNLDFGVNGYSNSWIESYQPGILPPAALRGKTLEINAKYGGYTFFGGRVSAPSFTFSNGDAVPAIPTGSAAVNHATCILSSGPPVVLGSCTSGIHADGSCTCM